MYTSISADIVKNSRIMMYIRREVIEFLLWLVLLQECDLGFMTAMQAILAYIGVKCSAERSFKGACENRDTAFSTAKEISQFQQISWQQKPLLSLLIGNRKNRGIYM